MGERIVEIELGRLREHPDNPNRQSKSVFKKLVANIKKTGRYEPLVVRPSKREENCFEIINGHHRKKALEILGIEKANCVVWDVDDEEVDILLTTLNRLSGSDDVYKRSEIIRRLCGRAEIKNLSQVLPYTKVNLEKLKELSARKPQLVEGGEFVLNPMVFLLSEEQKKIVSEAIEKASVQIKDGTAGQKKAAALAMIAEKFIECCEGEWK